MDNTALIVNSKGIKIPFDRKLGFHTKTRNFVAMTAIDWLNIYGENNGFTKDTDLENYDPTDFTKFIQSGLNFEKAVVDYLGER